MPTPPPLLAPVVDAPPADTAELATVGRVT